MTVNVRGKASQKSSLRYDVAIARNYHEILPYAFKRFSLLKALRTAVPTVGYELSRRALPKNEKPALCTMNILPPMMTVWYHFARKALGDRVDITIFDCSGSLKKSEFPEARVIPFLNLYAATKCQKFLVKTARHRRIGWICDDDMFFLNSRAVDEVEHAFQDPMTASVSFRPRTWWHFEIEGKKHPVSSSYCTAINREIFIDKEHLTLAAREGNKNARSEKRRPPSKYDTFDYANEVLIRKGYTCEILPEDVRDECVTGFSGISGAVMLLWLFKNPQQTINYFTSAPRARWTGSILYGALAGFLSIDIIQEMHERITGERYPLPSMPAREQLQALRSEYEPLLDRDRSYQWVDEVGEKLRGAI